MIRKAVTEDIDSIDTIYSKVHTEEEAGRMAVGWMRNVYPTRQTVIDAVEREDLFVEEIQGKIVAAGVINQVQTPEYAECPWEYMADASEIMVLHTLAVDPEETGHGYARKFIEFYETYALSQSCHYLRIDTQVKNQTARKMYNKFGFREAGIIKCDFNGIRSVDLICLEKKLIEE